jgi:molybdenum cofactor cytidylyltransferase
MLCLVDHPAVKGRTYQKLVAAARKDRIIIPVFNNKKGHPVIFGADFIDELLEKECPEGAKTIVRSHTDKILEICVDDPGVLLDIDTPKDNNRLQTLSKL